VSNEPRACRTADSILRFGELTFGSEFLSIENFASSVRRPRPPRRAPTRPVFRHAHRRRFASTIPWPASATEPARIGAIDQYPDAAAGMRGCAGHRRPVRLIKKLWKSTL